MTMVDLCRPFRDTWNRASDRCYHFFPCLSDPARRSSLCLKVAMVMLHLIYAGILFLFDRDLIEKTRREPWYTALYVLLFVATLAQYFFTSGSSPGYVLEAMRAVSETDALLRKTSMTSKQHASSKNGSLTVTVDGNQLGRVLLGSNATSWTTLVMDMYPPGSSISGCRCVVYDVSGIWYSLDYAQIGDGVAHVLGPLFQEDPAGLESDFPLLDVVLKVQVSRTLMF